MASAKRRIKPAIDGTVNADLDRRATKEVARLVRKEPLAYDPDPRGNPCCPRAVLAAVILRVFFVLTYAGIEARLKDSVSWNELFSRVPSKSVVQDKMKYVSMKQLRRVLRRLVCRVSRRLAADSTGIRTKDSCRWFDVRIKRKNSRRDYLKLHVLVDVEEGFIVDFVLTCGRAHDSPAGQRMLRRCTVIECFYGDGAYANRPCTQLVHERGGRSYVALREDATAKSKGAPGWRVTVLAKRADEAAYMAAYHIRSFVEAVFSSIKRRWGRAVHARKGWLKRREMALKVVAYNVRTALLWAEADARATTLYETIAQ